MISPDQLEAITHMLAIAACLLTLAAVSHVISRNHPAAIDVALGESGDES